MAWSPNVSVASQSVTLPQSSLEFHNLDTSVE